MKKYLWISSFCLLTAFSNVQGQSPTAVPATNDYAELLKKMQTLEQQLDVMQNQLKALQAIKGTKAPLDQPLLKSEQVIDWVQENITEIYSYNFANYKQVMRNITPYFTAAGYESYIKALQDSGNFKIIEEKKTIVTAMIVGDLKIAKEGIESGTYSWIVQVPLKVTYQDSVGVVVQDILANIQVVRINDEKHPDGIAIHSIEAQAKPDLTKPTAVKPETTKINKKQDSLPAPVLMNKNKKSLSPAKTFS